MSLKTDLDKFARKLVENCLTDTEKPVPFQEKLDCFKAVASYYAILAKHKSDAPVPVAGDTFDAFRETLRQEQENGGNPPPVHARRGSSGIAIDGETIGGPKLLRDQSRN